MIETPPIEKPWIPEARLKMVNERNELLRTESFLASQLNSIRVRINDLNFNIAESYGDIKAVVNEGVDRAMAGNKELGLRSTGEPK